MKRSLDVVAYNRAAWDREVTKGNPWTVPVSSEAVAEARAGRWQIILTPTKPVPQEWFPAEMRGCDVLCLASGGGQQGPILAAAGARVTVFDNSPAQLAQDRRVAEREELEIRTVQGDMADLSAFADSSFDLIVHPVSNVFAPAVRPVWREAARVLRPGAALLAGFNNPAIYLFDFDLIASRGALRVKFTLPYSDATSLSARALRKRMQEGWPLEYSHSLADQIGGQCDAGLVIAGLYEDVYAAEDDDLLSQYMPIFIATRAVKNSK